MNYMDEILAKIINDGFKIKINYRIVNGKYVLFMNHRKTVNGVTTQESKRLATLSGTDKKADLLKIVNAQNYRADYEKRTASGNIFKNESDKFLITNYIDAIATTYKKGSDYGFLSMKKHLVAYAGDRVKLSHIDRNFCQRFIEHLQRKNLKHASQLFALFKTVLYKAIDQEIIKDMPYLRKMRIKYHQSKREFLTEKELIQLKNTNTNHEDYKNAFIFGCFTGLRFVDLYNLKFSDIHEGKLTIKQSKTKEIVTMLLHDNAVDIIERQRKRSTSKIFNLKSYKAWQTCVPIIIKEAGITKRITGHCARHTFATLCITQGVDIYTTSKLLGHSDITTTQIYAKLIDEKKDEAIRKLPKI